MTLPFKVYLWLIAQKIDHKITWEVIKRAQPITDGNNPIFRFLIKESSVAVFAQKDGVA